MNSVEHPFQTDEDALRFHAEGRPGKLAIVPTKPMQTQRDLSLAYSPGVAAPVKAIAENPDTAFDYTAKGNLVAVISNGTAILGLGNLGALACKPVMEGKAVLFKRFADVDTIDIEVDAEEVDAFVKAVRPLHPSFGGINLEDIKAPDCFVIEEALRQAMPIPVFHDDQHGTAIIAAAGIVNALYLTGRRLEQVKLVVNGAGAAGIACLELLKSMGLPDANALLCDTKGVIRRGRGEGMNQWKSRHAAETSARTLEEALKGADVFLGLSVKGAVTKEMVASMAEAPIIFAMANPDPEITPEEARAARSDAIIATGRSDYPNQVNNVLGFPYIFRGALDVRATQINEAMKIAAVKALAQLAREDVPDEVALAYRGKRPAFGPEYIIPAPFDPRLIVRVSSAVAEAAMASGVARKPIENFEDYHSQLAARLDPAAHFFNKLTHSVRAHPKTVAFADGEEEAVARAAAQFQHSGLGKAILIGRADAIRHALAGAGIPDPKEFDIREPCAMAAGSYADLLYRKLQRRGALMRDCVRMLASDCTLFAAAMVEAGDADGMVAGSTRPFAAAFETVRQAIDIPVGRRTIGMMALFTKGRTVFAADTLVHDLPSSEQLADIAVEAAATARRFGFTPRVALLASSTFGYPRTERSERIVEAVHILDRRQVDFEYDGEIAVDVALDPAKLALYPFCRLSDTANVLVMPAVHSAAISTKLLHEVGGVSMLGPFLVGLDKPVQIVPLGAGMNEIHNAAVIAAL